MAYLLNLGLEHFQSGVRLVASEAEQEIRFDADGPTTFIASSASAFCAEWHHGCIVITLDAYKAEHTLPTTPSFDRIRELVESNARLQREVPEQADSRERCICGELLPCDHLAVEETSKVVR